jgi:hypothetical protein
MMSFSQFVAEAKNYLGQKVGQSGEKNDSGRHTILWYKHPRMGLRVIDHKGGNTDIAHGTWMKQEGIKDHEMDRLPRGRFIVRPRGVEEYLHTGKNTPDDVYRHVKKNYPDTRKHLFTDTHEIKRVK